MKRSWAQIPCRLIRGFGFLVVTVMTIALIFPRNEIPAQTQCPITWGHPEVAQCPDEPSQQQPNGGGGGGDPNDPIPCGTCLLGGGGGGGGGTGGPTGIAPSDDGTVAYTGRVDPSEDPTRDNVVVDPASGAMTFTLPLVHKIKGRASDLNLEMTFRSNLNWPKGKFGNFWQGNWQKVLVVEYSDRIAESECPDLPKVYEDRTWMNSIPRITEHNGMLGTRIWTNRDAIEGAHAFSASGLVSLPSGNLSGKIEIIPPDYSTVMDYTLTPSDCNEIQSRGEVQSLAPNPLGDLVLGKERLGYSHFVPSLGIYDKMDFACGEIRIRRADGTIDVFTQFRPRQEHRFPQNVPPNSPSSPQGGPPPEPYVDLRVQAIAVPLRTEYPNGDVLDYSYDTSGRLHKIFDTYNRSAIEFTYVDTTNRIDKIETKIAGAIQTTKFKYDGDDLLEEIQTPTDLSRTWRFDYGTPLFYSRPVIDPRIDVPSVVLLEEVRIFSPESPAGDSLPMIEAYLDVFDPIDPTTQPPTSKVVDLWLGNKYNATTGFIDNVGGVDYTFNTGKHSTYEYLPPVDPMDCFSGFRTVVRDENIGLKTTHTFDWMSRELSREDEFIDTSESFLTRYLYRSQSETEDDFHPKVRTTIHPNGNWTEEKFQFEEDDDLGRSYYTRDLFQGGNMLQRTRGHDDTEGPPFLVESWLYEPFTNQILSETDALDRVTSHTYDYQEGGWSAAFQAEWNGWGIDESYAGIVIPANPDDINGDGLFQQVGKRIETEHPVVDGPTATYTVEVEGGPQAAVELFGYNDKGQMIWKRDGEGFFTTYDYYPENDPDGDGSDLISGNTTEASGYQKETVVDADPPSGFSAPAKHNPINLTTTSQYDPIGRVLLEIDPRSISKRMQYDEYNRVVWEARGEIDAVGEALSTDSIFERTEFSYDGADNLIEVREANDDPFTGSAGVNADYVTERYGYDLLNQVRLVEMELVDPTESGLPSRFLRTFYHLDDNGKVIKEVSPEGRTTRYTYDPISRVITKRSHLTIDGNPSSELGPGETIVDPLVSFEYDKNGNLRYVRRRKTDDDAQVLEEYETQIVYDEFDRRTELLQPEGIKIKQAFDPVGNIIQVTKEGPRSNFQDDSIGGILTDGIYTWDARDRLAEVVTEYFTWQKINQVWQRSDGTDGLDRYAYDSRSLKVGERAHRSSASQPTETLTTTIGYDGVGREILREHPPLPDPDDPGGPPLPSNHVALTYDENGNVTEETHHEVGRSNGGNAIGADYVVMKEYDELDRMIKESILPAGQGPGLPPPIVTECRYTSRGDKFEVINPRGVGTRIFFDTQHREVRKEFGYDETFAMGVIEDLAGVNSDGLIRIESKYDDDSNVRFQKDDAEKETETTYDGAGRLAGLKYADSTREAIAYNRDGTIGREEKYGSANDLLFSVDYGYDLALRKILADVTHQPVNLPLEGVTQETFAYDGLSRVSEAMAFSFVTEETGQGTTRTEFDTTVTKSYDSLGNVVADDQAVVLRHYDEQGVLDDERSMSDTVTCDFDTKSNRVGVSCASGGYDVTYSFDLLNRIESIQRDGIAVHSFEYVGPEHRLLKLTNANGTTTKPMISGYDEFRRLTRLEHLGPQGGMPDFGYSYDAAGNQLEETRHHETTKHQTFEYDKVNRLLRAYEGANGDSTDPLKEAYGQDGVGNWRQHTVEVSPGVVQTFSQTVNDVHAYDSFDGSVVEHDKRGNLTRFVDSSKDSVYTYDVRGRIVKAVVTNVQTGSATTHLYAYDAEGRRVLAEGWFFVHEKEREIKQIRPNQVRDFVYGTGIDDVCSYRRNGVEYTIHKNRIGSAAAITDSLGNLAETHECTPYGKVTSTDLNGGGFVGFPYLFAGRRLDAGTGLYFFRARSYHPEMGRYTARDQIGLWGDANNWGNPYAYGFNNPFSGHDPTGHFWGKIRDAVAGTLDGVASGLTFGLYSGSVAGDLMNADTGSLTYQGANLVGNVAGGIGTGVLTGGAGALGTIARAGQVLGRAQDLYETGKSTLAAADKIANGDSSGWKDLGRVAGEAVGGKAAGKLGNRRQRGQGDPKTDRRMTRRQGKQNLRKLGVGGVKFSGRGFNNVRRQLENRGFTMGRPVDSGRITFTNRNGTKVIYDPSDKNPKNGQRESHWHIHDSGGTRYDKQGRPVDKNEGSAHVK